MAGAPRTTSERMAPLTSSAVSRASQFLPPGQEPLVEDADDVGLLVVQDGAERLWRWFHGFLRLPSPPKSLKAK